MRFKTAFWQFILLSMAFLWSLLPLFKDKFIIGISIGILYMLFLDFFLNHYKEWKAGMKRYKLPCGCVLKTNDPEGSIQLCIHGNKFVKK